MDSLSLQESTWSTTEMECVDMHTTGQPTRIAVRGFPALAGTLLEQREQIRTQHDNLRRRIMLEPRGHMAMFGAILRQRTELTESGDAHIGILFINNDGFSDMCGHGTIAVSRLLVDTHERDVFPLRMMLPYDRENRSVQLKLHTPSGVVIATVPTTHNGGRSDPSRDVEFISTPAFVAGINVSVEVPPMFRWDEKTKRNPVNIDIAYAGAWYGIVSAYEMGFYHGIKLENLEALKKANQKLRDAMSAIPSWKKSLSYPQHLPIPEIQHIMITDGQLGLPLENSSSAETGILFHDNQQIDRSPTGGCVIARVAVTYRKGLRSLGEPHTYHSIVSNALGGQGRFIGTPVEEVDIFEGHGLSAKGVKVRVAGKAFASGRSTYLVEEGDPLGDGFSLNSFLKKFQ